MLKTIEHDLQRSTPEQQGIASSAVLQFVEAVDSQIHEFHSFMLLRHGKVVAEGWWSPYGREHPHMLFSLSKSFTSTAVGMAVAEGRLSIDDTVLSFFPDEAPAEVNEHLAAMQVRHLLSMSTGHPADTMPYVVEQAESNWVKGFFEAPVVHQPGTHFFYNTGATYMQSAIVQKVTGMKLIEYLAPRLFEPLGIENATWQESPQGINTGGFGLNITTEDIAKFGQLYLQTGMWGDRRLVPEAWIEAATFAQISNGDNAESDWAQGYGYQFWRCRHNIYRGDGAFGQYCIVMPEQDAVIAITGGLGDMQQPLNLVWDILLPAMQGETLPEDAEAQGRLAKKLSSLNHAPVQGKTSSPLAAKVSGQTYQFDSNDLRLETISLNFDESGCVVRLKTDSAEEQFACGYGNWQAGQTTLFNAPWEPAPERIVTSGAWRADDKFSTVIRLYETSFFQTMTFHFAGDKLTIETIVNVGFEPPKTSVLTGHSR
jgi:CubicO group peptidase (beta-lactamase class C family)